MKILDRIGNTRLLALDGVFVKLECSNPGGSVKDRIAKFMLEEAAKRGDLKPGDAVVEATSGNTGIALAMVARELGYRAIIFMPEHMSVERAQMMRGFGADVRLTSKEGGFEGAIALRDAYRGQPGHFVPDQFGNADNTRCHRLTTGVELVSQLREAGVGQLGAFVAGVGTGGTLMGIGQALRAAMPGVRVVAVEPDESAVMSGGPAGEHGIMGIGDGFIPDLVDMAEVDDVVRVSTDDAHHAAARIRRDLGFCVGRSAGANLVAAERLRAVFASVATVFADCADRYVSVGLESPHSDDVTCPLQATCAARGDLLLGGPTSESSSTSS